ncbi:MAG: tRNA pseudouridine(55) synthase TruB [Chloracidobacterium sp.]|nr:tRNA pseudouridine(55) synthase TruB [Chloracidobacterium sp.]
MNGILIIDKPAGITSHDVVSRVRRILKTKRVGHTGTLDPFATGVMVILVGQATRLAQFLDKDEKEYEATVKFGFETDTGDATGTRSAECGMRNEEIEEILASAKWDITFEAFRGEIKQVPPMYSAKKIDGKKLYEHARKGEVIERKPVAVTIHKLEIIDSALRIPHSAFIRVVCSAGTYIRTLAEDIGRQVGIGAHLAELRRTRAGKFTIEQSLTLDELERLDEPASALIAMTEAVSHLQTIVLPDDRVDKTKNGLATRATATEFKDGESIQMQDANGNLIAIGFYNEVENVVQPKVVLV